MYLPSHRLHCPQWLVSINLYDKWLKRQLTHKLIKLNSDAGSWCVKAWVMFEQKYSTKWHQKYHAAWHSLVWWLVCSSPDSTTLKRTAFCSAHWISSCSVETLLILLSPLMFFSFPEKNCLLIPHTVMDNTIDGKRENSIPSVLLRVVPPGDR